MDRKYEETCLKSSQKDKHGEQVYNFVQYHWLWFEGEWPPVCLGSVRDSALVEGGETLQTWRFQKSSPFPMCLSLPCISISKYKLSATATCLSLLPCSLPWWSWMPTLWNCKQASNKVFYVLPLPWCFFTAIVK